MGYKMPGKMRPSFLPGGPTKEGAAEIISGPAPTKGKGKGRKKVAVKKTKKESY